jgi:hypothetical protein
MHTQHVKFSAYILGGGGVGGVVALVLIFEEGEMSGLAEDDDRSALEVVDVAVTFLPWPLFLLLVLVLLDLLDFIDTI